MHVRPRIKLCTPSGYYKPSISHIYLAVSSDIYEHKYRKQAQTYYLTTLDGIPKKFFNT